MKPRYTPLMAAILAAVSSPSQAEEAASQALPTVVVQDAAESAYNTEKASSPKFSQSLLDTPKTVSVVTEELMREQGVTSLREALKNVSGIAMAAGEGGVPAGDNLTIRGFSARTDLFVDGVRDFGGYTRDTFNLEKVEVVKGPSSAYTGRGSTGGSVNMVSKAPQLDDFVAGQAAVGTDNLGRAVLDVNQTLGDSTALRLNLMGHTQEFAGRDEAEAKRWGVAPSIAFGLGTDTRLTLSYFHLQQDNIPDYGHPFLSHRPVNVSRENFYGLSKLVYEDTKTDIFTAIIENDINENVSLRNTTRIGRAERNSIINAPRDPNVVANTVTLQGKARDSRDDVLSNQTDAVVNFKIGTVEHALVAGLEFSGEKSKNNGRTLANVTGANLTNPDNNASNLPAITRTGLTETEARNFAAYVFDSVKLNDYVSLNGGLRYDDFRVDYASLNLAGQPTTTSGDMLHSGDDIISYEAGLVFKPVANGSVYVSYGTSANPSAEGLSLQESAGVSTGTLEPETAKTVELGTKWRLLDNRLQLSSAVFRTEKSDVRTRLDSGFAYETVGKQRVDGFELSLSGNITDAWQVITSYTYLDSETMESKDPDEVGRDVANVAPQSFNLWSTYHLSNKWQVGMGAQYVDDRISSVNSAEPNQVPDYVLVDAMVGFHLTENVDIALNAYNLEDKKYYDQLGNGHTVPGMGRTAVLSTSFKF